MRIKDQYPGIVIQGIYAFSKAISQFQIVYEYFVNNKISIVVVNHVTDQVLR